MNCPPQCTCQLNLGHSRVEALKQIGTPEALSAITAWQDDLTKKGKQAIEERERRNKAEVDAEKARIAGVANEKAAQVRERQEILALEPQNDFQQVLEIIYDNSLNLRGISASHYKRTRYKNGVKYSINAGPGNPLNTNMYIIPTKREDVFRVRIIGVETLTYYALNDQLRGDEDRIVNATPGMAEYYGVTGVIDLATGVMQWF